MGGELKRTPLHGEHVGHGAKLVDFNGWEMPVQYPSGILKEHEAVRTGAGLFDVSHMGRFSIDGPGSIDFVDHVVTNSVKKAEPGQLLYTPVCHEAGGVLDDVTVYRYADRVLMVVNAGNLERIWEWLGSKWESWKGGEVRLTDQSRELAQIALQGPKADAVLQPLAEGDLSPIGYYRFWTGHVAGVEDVLVSRNGYTGEDGFEIYLPAQAAPEFWRRLMESGKAVGIAPAGLGARDTLRMEMGYALYGNELNPEIHPLEAGLGWTVKLKKDDFIGRDALLRVKAEGLKKALVGFEVAGGRLPRHGQAIWWNGSEAGFVTSGGFAPSLKKGIGLGYAPPAAAEPGTELEVEVRGEKVPVRVVERPFYKDASHR